MTALIIVVTYYSDIHTQYNDYEKYVIPMKQYGKIDPSPTHVDWIPVYRENPHYFGLISHITLLDDESIRVRFEGGRELLPFGYYPAFTYEETYHKGDNFVVLCIQSENRTFFSLYEYNGTVKKDGRLFITMIHGHAEILQYLPCDFPQVLKHSKNIFSLEGIFDIQKTL